MLTPLTLRGTISLAALGVNRSRRRHAVITTVVGGISQIVTGTRIYYGQKTDLLGLDDLFGASAMFFSLIGLVGFWIMTDSKGVL